MEWFDGREGRAGLGGVKELGGGGGDTKGEEEMRGGGVRVGADRIRMNYLHHICKLSLAFDQNT